MEQDKLIALLNDMTLEEKIDQMLQVSGMFYTDDGVLTGPANTAGYTEEEIRLAGSVLGTVGAGQLKRIQREYMERHPHHIPLIFMADIINGFRTVFPIPLAQGCTFDPELVEECAAVAARESAAAGLHLTFSPMADLVRDARWGRVMESTGEDAWLNGCFARAMVEGYQGRSGLREKGRIAACVKHFAGYGAPTAGRDYNTVELSERTLRDDYLPAYREAIDAGAATVMTSFNTLDRVPSSANRRLMRDILRGEMGFEGVLISDWAAIEELCSHGVARDKEEAARLALEAGVDIDMMTNCYCKHLKELVESGAVSGALIDEAVLRILKLKNDLGLFENPYKDADEQEEKVLALCDAHRRIGFLYKDMEKVVTPNILRYRGYIRALEENGIPVDERLIAPGIPSFGMGFRAGFQAMKGLMQRNPDMTAVFAFSDVLAIGAAKAVLNAGKQIPEDISVIGFDGIEMAEFYNPTLDTVYQPATEMALSAVSLLHGMMNGERTQHIVCDSVIMKRGSVKMLR